MEPNRGRTCAATVQVLVVEDEPDVELLFLQQFRREVREVTASPVERRLNDMVFTVRDRELTLKNVA